ncbi:hypothetical protein GCK72_002260 [Caenorhabditis remanei]|uniref:SUN domain-containing protein n=1 Tax=Caenorhabditis remanei TaxID=31234 RepID=A0A6A5HTJ2_CAERE|nr:hypothetical protein GCK72_002260 [Caenorhabditis remanei]KAF1770441.1 hypothetical protein GCK72_002260 [Caenorhabditis remanei]
MKLKQLLIFCVLLVLPNIHANQDVSFVKHWKDILLTDGDNGSMCYLSVDECTRAAPYNITKKVIKTSVNASEKESVPEKSIESFDEWTKKRRDAVANQNGQHQKTVEPTPGTTIRHDEVVISLPSISRPARNFASRECGAKVIAANLEAENAKAVVNEKDVDDYMRNPCQSAKEKFIVIELCEAIQIKKFAIGNFELFASRPKTVHVFISERYPPLTSWVSLGTFNLQDHHKQLQTFEVPNTNIYAKYIRINLEDHYGKEHYCIVSVVNVMGSTLADEYDKEEAAAHLLNVIDEKKDEPVTTPPPSEQKVQTQLPVPPKSSNQNNASGVKAFNFRQLKSICSQCSAGKVSYLICHLLPRQSKPIKLNPTPKPFSAKPPVTENKNLTVELGLWAERSRQSNFEQSRRRNMATIQRLLEKKNALEPETFPPSTMTFTEPSLSKIENGEKPAEKVAVPEEAKSSSQPAVQPPFQEQPPPKSKTEHILPAGGSTSQREMVLMKLSKRIAAVEMNLTLSTEYLSELSKQYVSQMSGYQQELKETRKASRKSSQTVEAVMHSKINNVKRELRDLRHSVYLLQQLENNRYKNAQNEMSRNVFMSSCHISSNVPPSPTLARLPLVIPSINSKFENFTNFEERVKKIYQTAKSVMFGSITWNTDHLIVALISFNVLALSFLFAGVFYIHRRNKERCEETQVIVKNELRARIAKIGADNRKMISKGMRRAELAVTAAVSSALKVEKTSSNRKTMTELETALANLFAAQQIRIEEQFEQNQKILRDALTTGQRSSADDTLSMEGSESSSETEQSKEDTPTFNQD